MDSSWWAVFEEKLVDFFSRQHHVTEVARSRAQAVVEIARGCDPFQQFQEGAVAVETVERFNQREQGDAQ